MAGMKTAAGDEFMSLEDQKWSSSDVALGEKTAEESRVYSRCRAHPSNTFILAIILVTSYFYFQQQPPSLLPLETPNPPPRLVRYDTPSLNATSTAATAAATNLVVDLGVYQPVLSPAGAVDQTISNDGTRYTGVVASAPTNGTCATISLMDYSFGQSYGVPFVSMYRLLVLQVLILLYIRHIHTTELQLQSSHYKFHSKLNRTSIRSTCYVLSEQYRNLANVNRRTIDSRNPVDVCKRFVGIFGLVEGATEDYIRSSE